MRNDKKNFLLDLAIFLDFILLDTGIPANRGEHSVWLWVHAGAGLTLAICLIWHIIRHRWWFRAALGRTGKQKPEKFPYNRWINLTLLVFSALTILTGILTLASGQIGEPLSFTPEPGLSCREWQRLHETGAFFLSVLVFWHLIVHMKWSASVARTLFQNKTNDGEGKNNVSSCKKNN